MNAKVLCAIFKRNFVAYFSTPTGYVFICLFVFFSSAAAFWPHEFFASNLANLDQLHRFFPLIMLFFAPAITMGAWADERRQGTDELVLTIPANDLDVVLGKYLAVVGIYCASLAFSFVSNVLLLNWMGSPDLGLLFANYVGYFFVGLAMLAIGMIASFLTGNVTIAMVIGVLLNGPLVIIGFLSPERRGFGISARFEDFGRGIISFSSVAYFLFIAIAALYVCMVLIGRRHWMGGRDGSSMLGHFLARTVAIIIGCIGMIYFLGNHDVRPDLTVAQLNSLSPDTVGLLATLNAQPLKNLATRREELEKKLAAADKKPADELARLKQRLEQMNLEKQRLESPVEVEAFLSKNVSDRYATKRLDLISILREMENLARGKLTVTIHDMEPFSELAEQASEQYGIEPRQVSVETRGIMSEEKVFLGAVVRSGLKQVVIPFFELGIPTEYELIRSIYTVGQSKRKTLGVVRTDANLFGGGFDMQRAMRGLGPLPAQPIVEELRKHYKVVDVDPNMPIVNDPDNPDQEKYDVLLVAQPSSLPTRQLANLAAAISSGIPTAIFEDPFPYPPFSGNVPGTDAPRRSPQQQMMMMQQQQRPEPKGNIDQLWNVLGIRMIRQQSSAAPPANPHGFASPPGGIATAIVWQNFNPYPELRFSQGVTSEWIFANDSAGGAGFRAFDEKDNISRGMYELLFPFPGAIKESGTDSSKSLTFTPLVRTSSRSGYLFPNNVQSSPPHKLRELEKPTGTEYTLAARISGTIARQVPADLPDGAQPDPTKPPPMKTVTQEISAVVVADIDMLSGAFFSMRANPQRTGIKLQFQNVPFILNIVESLGSDQPKFVEIRKRRQLHGRLTRFQQDLQETVNREMETAIDSAQTKLDEETESAKKELEKLLKDANEKYAKKQKARTMTATQEKAIVDELKLLIETAQDRETIQKVSLTQEFSRTKAKIDAQRKRQTYRLNDYYKAVASAVPPLPPLIVALFVFIFRRSREKEGVASSRLR